MIVNTLSLFLGPIIAVNAGPEVYGGYASFIGIITLLGVLMMFEGTTMLFRLERDFFEFLTRILKAGFYVFLLVIFLALTLSVIGYISRIHFLYIVCTALTIATNLLVAFNIRSDRFYVVAKSKVYTYLIITSLHLLIVYNMPDYHWMIVAYMFSQCFAIFFLSRESGLTVIFHLRIDEVKFVIKKYKENLDIIKYSYGGQVINVAGNNAIIILTPMVLGLEQAGLYAIVHRILGIPLSLVSTAIQDAFKLEYTEGSDRKLVATKFLIITVSFGILFLFGVYYVLPTLVSYFSIPSDWLGSLSIALVLAPLYFIRFVVSPLSFILVIKRRLNHDILWQILNLLIIFSSFFFLDIFWKYICISGLISYSIYFIIIFHAQFRVNR